MTYPFMTAVAEGLAERRVVPLHISFPPFPATERCSRRPDRPALARSAPALQTSKMAGSGLSASEKWLQEPDISAAQSTGLATKRL